ncbi:MAG TPA: crosslink repair DNA glycosylase YcaQ family protein [Terriglobales bacterium]|jgi:hypothetical protein|nr:crosslink repair DNA glycosylase YcaQ family protein [Terriglobales bacterium]
MTDQELQDLRKQKWHLDGGAIRTQEDARGFIESVGFCLMYPVPRQEMRTPALLPTFMGAWAGTEEKLPTWQHAFTDPRAQEATEMMIRLLRERAAFEANLFGESNLLIAASIFPFFYGLTGDRNPRQKPKPGVHYDYSPLARDAFEIIRRQGPISRSKLQEALGGDVSSAALDRGLGELWSKLRITRVDYKPQEGAFWDALYRWAPEPVREGINMSLAEALSALVSKYLDCVVAAELGEVEDFFSHLVARSKVKEAVNALIAAREVSFVHLGSRTLIQLTPPRASVPRRVGA